MTVDSRIEGLLSRITDPRGPAEPNAVEAASDRLALPYLVDARDVIFTRLLTRIALTLLPLSVGMFFIPTWLVGVLAVPYLAWLFGGFGGRLMLAVHAVAHRPLFKKKYGRADLLITHALPMLWGLTPFAYRNHHVRMHHVESIGADDLSSTIQYQRDNPVHFAHYWLRFVLFGYFHMISWLVRKGQTQHIAPMVIGEIFAYGFIAAMVWLNPAAGIVVFVLPYCLMRFFMMAGTWTEHAFVDVDQPLNDYRTSTCLLNTPYNHKSYNAGYHLIHHLVPGLHWADTLPYFEKHLHRLVDEDAIVFDGVPNNQAIFWKLMLGDYDYLAERLVDLGNRRPSHEERVAFLKERVQRTRGSWKGLLERRELGA